jgi:Fe-S cluster biogenesis protein NfuA
MESMNIIGQIIEQKIRPLLNAHQGDIELVEITSDGYVKVRLTGACATCSGAQQTLSEVVEAKLKEACPEIQGVIPVFQVSDDLIRQALRIIRKGNT